MSVPPGATIERAVLKWHIYSYDGDTWQMTVRGIAQDSATPFSSGDLPSSRPMTVASQAWNLAEAPMEQWITSPDLSSIIQEIVGRPGWVAGNALALYVQDPSQSGFLYISDFNRGASYAPVLEIDYSLGGTTSMMSDPSQDAILVSVHFVPSVADLLHPDNDT